MKTKKPTAIVYGWDRIGHNVLTSDIYWEEGLHESVEIYSLTYTGNIELDYTKYKPDLIISFGQQISISNYFLLRLYRYYETQIPDNILANDIVCQTVFKSCEVIRPRFSIFTPTYNTGERIKRTYESIRNQTLKNWQWVVVDDSPTDDTFNILKEIEALDYRVKVYKINPITGGNVGLAKHRAAMLSDGDWLVELDHDDCLTSSCLEVADDAISKFPEGGFLYSDCCEMYETGEFKYYDHDWTGNWYARPDNFFDFGYAGHEWEIVDGNEILAHRYPDINPLSIRFNISMPNHVRMWERNLYHKINGHNKSTPVADDLEILIRTFLNTRMIHVKKVLYIQYSSGDTTTDNNAQDINRRARLIRDYYDLAIHNRIHELGFVDWNWIEEEGNSQKLQCRVGIKKYYDEEQKMNFIYE
jgi:glycosyltransferase involved in cell wall biosynthesis